MGSARSRTPYNCTTITRTSDYVVMTKPKNNEILSNKLSVHLPRRRSRSPIECFYTTIKETDFEIN